MSAPPGSPDEAVLELLRSIARDVAHEMRGPVQAVVVNAEVARRRLAADDAAAVAERIDILDSEVRRLHEMNDAFLSLIRPDASEPRISGIDAMLGQIEPLLAALARAARTELVREAEGHDAIVRVRPQPLALSLTALVAALNATCGQQARLLLVRRADDDCVELVARIVRDPDAAGPPPDPGPGPERAILAAAAWLAPEGGTVEVVPGSDPRAPAAVRIRLPRADIA